MHGVEPIVAPRRERLRLDAATLLADVRRAASRPAATVTASFSPSAPR